MSLTRLEDPLYSKSQVAPVRVVAATNQVGSYLNGPTNNGVRATFTYTSASALTIDSVAIALGDYVLLAGQTLGYENGIYQVTNAGSSSVSAVLQRRSDYQSIEQIRTGWYVPVYAGTVYAGSQWMLIEPAPLAIGVPAIVNANNLVYAANTSTGSSLYLQSANNLSDVASATAALANLGVHSAKFTNAGGSATTTISDARITAASVVVGNWQSSTNAVTVEKVTPGASSITVLSSGDPGSSVFSYVATSGIE